MNKLIEIADTITCESFYDLLSGEKMTVTAVYECDGNRICAQLECEHGGVAFADAEGLYKVFLAENTTK